MTEAAQQETPEFVKWMTEIKPETQSRLKEFAKKYGYSMKDVLDSALLDYMDNHDAPLNPGFGNGERL